MENMKAEYPFSRPGLVVSQPFGQFFVTAIPARVLLDAAFSDRLTAVRKEDGTYDLEGSQRKLVDRRMREIGMFIDSSSVAFPNSVILAANYREEDGLIEDDDDLRWRFDISKDGFSGRLTIPKPLKLAPIIDGQHRLFGFNFADKPDRLDVPLLCAVYFDLPKPYQAFLFATINANQRPVTKSQTYELFGYNVEDEPPEKWTPEKLAVFLTRKLNTESDSPFHGHIVVAAENDFAPTITEVRRSGSWAVSTATIVEGIVRLISSNPKKDAYAMDGKLEYRADDRAVLEPSHDEAATPLRGLYLAKNDDLIYTGVKNYFAAVDRLFWKRAEKDSYIRKTVGVQALFDIARKTFRERVEQKDFSLSTFERMLKPASQIDFADRHFEASGRGRQWIRTSIELAMRLRNWDTIKPDDEKAFRAILAVN
jgi:DNA phosphorothioation-associated DGQHR protein 1